MRTIFVFTFALFMLPLVAQAAATDALDAPPAQTEKAECPAATPVLSLLTFDGLQGAVLASSCTASADCGANPPVSCSGNSSCSSTDRNCSSGAVNGWVTCDGQTTVCTTDQSCTQGCASDWNACVAQCSPGILNPCRIACSEARGICNCNC